MFKKILVGVDPTHEEEAARAIVQALRLLEEGGTLYLLTVVNHPGGPAFFPVVLNDNEMAELGREANRHLEVLMRKHVPLGISVDPIVRQGSPGRVLIDETTEVGAELLVLVEHGHRWPFARDTVHFVASHTHCPVFLVPGVSRDGQSPG